jgi:hypothetical protein
MVGLYDYEKTENHPAFNLALRVNFVCGGGETGGFKFTGSEGVMLVDRGVTLTKPPKESEPGMTPNGFSRATSKKIVAEYRKKYPEKVLNADNLESSQDEQFLPPHGYSDDFEHHTNFFNSVRSRKPVVEDATFGLRAAGPALLANMSYYENRIKQWDPVNMRVVEA